MNENSIKEIQGMVEELSDRLAENFFQTIQILSSIVLYTEKYYEGSHSRFVSEKSAQVAQELGMKDEDVMEVKIAGLLHDMGKIGFSDTLLYKHTAEMSESEIKQYHLYPIIGYQLLKQNNNFKDIAKIVLQHQEKLDGSGFPNHLHKDDIHPSAKIIIVAEHYHSAVYKRMKNRASFDAPSTPLTSSSAFLDMTEERYKKEVNYLNKKKGVLFEKKVVDAFLNIIEIERSSIGEKTVTKIPVNKIEPGMIFADDYYTTYGMLIAAKGEITSADMKNALVRFVESGELPPKILVIT